METAKIDLQKFNDVLCRTIEALKGLEQLRHSIHGYQGYGPTSFAGPVGLQHTSANPQTWGGPYAVAPSTIPNMIPNNFTQYVPTPWGLQPAPIAGLSHTSERGFSPFVDPRFTAAPTYGWQGATNLPGTIPAIPGMPSVPYAAPWAPMGLAHTSFDRNFAYPVVDLRQTFPNLFNSYSVPIY